MSGKSLLLLTAAALAVTGCRTPNFRTRPDGERRDPVETRPQPLPPAPGDHRPPPQHHGHAFEQREVHAKEIKARTVRARVIYAKEVKAGRGNVGRIVESREGEKGWGNSELRADLVSADVIYAKEIHADFIEAEAIYAKEVKLGDGRRDRDDDDDDRGGHGRGHGKGKGKKHDD